MSSLKLDDTIVDLGRDQSLMTATVAADQRASVNRILEAFCGPKEHRREVQLLADEVGLGKTFVALAVAYTMLRELRRGSSAIAAGFNGAHRAVVVMTPPGNHALASKWRDEVGALVKRCALKPEEFLWFKSCQCETPEDLLIGLNKASDLRRRPGSVPTVFVCEAGIFTRRLRESGPKLRFISACLFQWLGPTVTHEVRRHVVRRARECPGYEDWADGLRPGEAVNLWDFAQHERFLALDPESEDRLKFAERRAFEAVPFTYSEVCDALDRFARTDHGHSVLYDETLRPSRDEGPRGLVPYCKWIAEKIGHAELFFDGFKTRVSALYRELFNALLNRSLPLVIADEAHHWRRDTQGCRCFLNFLAPRTHRLLLLSATPFQLCRDELANMLSRADGMQTTIGEDRVIKLTELRQQILAAMEQSETAGSRFSRLWGRLATDLRTSMPDRLEASTGLSDGELTTAVAKYWAVLLTPGAKPEQRLLEVPGRIRPFFASALELLQSNRRLGQAMRQLIIRHRRDTTHRRYRVGREYPPSSVGQLRPDCFQLHAARGSALPPDAELAQFLLMKVVASATRGRRKTALGMDVTGAYSTLWESQEGRKAVKASSEADTIAYSRLLGQLTGGRGIPNKADRHHPKVQTMVSAALDAWERDEKTLIFCFRLPTAQVLRKLIADGIEDRTRRARRALLRERQAISDDAALAQFKRSLTSRTGSVLPAFMDRVLLGIVQRNGGEPLALERDELRQVAEFAARARSDGRPAIRDAQKPDRVLLFRICEHVLALRYRATLQNADEFTLRVLDSICNPRWIENRYGLQGRGIAEDDDNAADVLTRSSLGATYGLDPEPDAAIYNALLQTFGRAHSRHAVRTLDSLVGGANVFLPLPPFEIEPSARERGRKMTDLLWTITIQGGTANWAQRAEVVDAVNRALLRDHFLLRLPRSVFAGDDERWSEALVRGFHSGNLFGGHGEPVAEKVADFLQGLVAMTPEERSHSLRYALNPQAKAVVLVSGGTKERDAVFRGFNSPLLPEILICTQVGQEGIDLHRNCRHVVHYDLGWNPATIEQRTGRVDRIGSKAQRERKLAGGNGHEETLPGLEIGLPYLAATYDERMFDRLYRRAQAFDLLTGGDPSADADDSSDDLLPNEPGATREFVPLPDEMRTALRVDLRAVRQD